MNSFEAVAANIERNEGFVVDHFHLNSGQSEEIIFRVTDALGVRFMDIAGYTPRPTDTNGWLAHKFHGYEHEPLFQRAQVEEPTIKEPWYVRLAKRVVSW